MAAHMATPRSAQPVVEFDIIHVPMEFSRLQHAAFASTEAPGVI
jgi:hypothetical protein